MSILDAPVNLRRLAAAVNVKDIILREGIPYGQVLAYTGSLSAGSINQTLGNFTLPVNRAFFLQSASVNANCYCDIQIAFASPSGTGVNLVATDLGRVSASPVAGPVFTMEKLITQINGNPSTGVLATASVRRVRNADGTDAAGTLSSAVVSVAFNGIAIYDDQNWGADKIIKYWGDSIFNGTGRTSKLTCYDWKIRTYYSDTAGQNVRGVMKAVSGSTSTDHETFRQNGWHDEPQVDLLVYELMANDAASGISAATYTANLNAAIRYKQQRWPNAKMLVLGCHPLMNSAREANAVTLRAAAAAAVTAAADPRIFYCNLGDLGGDTSFKTTAANYTSSDTTSVSGATLGSNGVVTGVASASTTTTPVGSYVTGTGVLANSYIASVQAGTGFTLNQTGHTPGSGLTLSIGNGVHPTDTADNLIWNGNSGAGGSTFAGLKAFLTANIPTI